MSPLLLLLSSAMTVKPNPVNPPRPRRARFAWSVWLDVMAIVAWGALLLKYWLTEKINILLHPSYAWLSHSAAIFLLALGGIRAIQLLTQQRQKGGQAMTHISLFPPGLGSAILLAIAILGLQFTPRPFSSDVAIDRGVTETLAMTRSKPQAFRSSNRSEEKSLVDWVRTLNVYPEPDAYTGQKATVEGFVIRSPDLPENHFMLSRFIITCCAADAYPAGLPVKLPDGVTMPKADMWLRVEGSMITASYGGKRNLVIDAKKMTEIPEPKNPYDY